MRQCSDCEFFVRSPTGEISFTCDPFSTVKEPECLAKWQLLKTNQLVAGYQAMLAYYQKFAPLQEKMFKVVEREIEDMNESEKWKNEAPVDDDEDDPTWDVGKP